MAPSVPLGAFMAVVIYEDSRQQEGKHDTKRKWFERHGIEVVRRKLDFGDYMTEGSNVSVDTKRGISEVAMDVGRDHDRFAREMERAREAGYRLVILVECGAPYRSVDDVAHWTNKACRMCEHYKRLMCDPNAGGRCKRFKRKPMRGQTVAKTIKSMADGYGCIFEFVHPAHSAMRICELLGVKYD